MIEVSFRVFCGGVPDISTLGIGNGELIQPIEAVKTFNKNAETGSKETNIPEAVNSGSKAIKEGASKVKVKENKSDGSSTEVEIESTPEANKAEETYDSYREDYDTIAKDSKDNF